MRTIDKDAYRHVLGTFCYPSLRAGQLQRWRSETNCIPTFSSPRLAIRQIGRFEFESCHPEDAVSCELVSVPNSLLTGKLTGNFAESGPPPRFFESDQRTHSIVYSRIPCATEQGISKRVSGKIFQGTGNRHADIRRRSALKHARCVDRCLLMGVKRTKVDGPRMSAYDPELTLSGQICCDAQLSVCSTIW
jgi:hypothetical protein